MFCLSMLFLEAALKLCTMLCAERYDFLAIGRVRFASSSGSRAAQQLHLGTSDPES